jgi:hypothetical protein
MSRNKGTFNFSGNFEGNVRGPIDAKMIVSLKSDLTDTSTWYNVGNEWTYVGMPVSVSSDPTTNNNGIYVLNGSDYTNINNWVKLSKTPDASINSLFAYNVIQDASINLALNSVLGILEGADRTIYVDVSGNDTTGDGSIGNPYKTIYKALTTIGYNMDGHTITIKLSSGIFQYDASCDYIRTQQANGEIVLQGTKVYDTSILQITQPNPTTDPFTYNVSVNEVTPSWTNNQWRKYFIDVSAVAGQAYPIASSSTWTLEVSDVSLTRIGKNKGIFHLDTSINLASSQYTGEVQFMELKVNLNSSVIFGFLSNNFSINHIRCIFTTSVAAGCNLYYYGAQGNINACYNENIKIYPYLSSVITFGNNVFTLPTSTGGISLNYAQLSSGTVFNSIFFRDAVGQYGIYVAQGASIIGNYGLNNLNQYYLKFKNINYPFYPGTIISKYIFPENFNIILENTSYLLRMSANVAAGISGLIAIFKNKFIGSPTLRWIYDTGEFVKWYNPPMCDIDIQGVLYREIDPNNILKLVTNTTTDISIGSLIQNKSISVDYTVQRATSYAEGSFNILIDSCNNLIPSVDRYISSGTGADASAIRFDAVLDVSIVKWRTTLDASGGDASLNYNITRVMKYPFTL